MEPKTTHKFCSSIAIATEDDTDTNKSLKRSSNSTGIFIDLKGEDEIKVELQSPLLDDDNSHDYNVALEDIEDHASPLKLDAKMGEYCRNGEVLATSWNRVVSWSDNDHGRNDSDDMEHGIFLNRNGLETSLMESLLSNEPSSENSQDNLYNDRQYPHLAEGQKRRFAIAAVFLHDFEHGRPCSLPPNIDSITSIQLVVHKIRFSILWQLCVYVAVWYLFISSYFEGHNKGTPSSPLALFVLTLVVDVIFALDMTMKRIYSGYDSYNGSYAPTGVDGIPPTQHGPNIRKARNRWWNILMIWLLLALSCETAMKFWVNQLHPHPNEGGFELCIWSGVLKPIVFFYVSSKAQDAISALSQVASIVSKVIIMELFIILSFSAVACHLYSTFDSFSDLPNSFKSLFELSTTAVTPSIWIPVYNEDRSSALFFILFIIICVFYLHSLVLSVVFQTYIQAMGMIRDRASADRDEALKLAFLALQPVQAVEGLSDMVNTVQVSQIRMVLRKIRPHYSDTKIDGLVQIVDPTNIGVLDFSAFRCNVPKAIHTSLRSNRQGIRNSLMLKPLATFVATINLCFVLVLSLAQKSVSREDIIIPAGTIIVLLCIFEVTLRFFLCYFSCIPTTSMHGFLDGVAALAGAISIYGLFLYPSDHHQGMKCLLLGRAIDMIRIIRLSSLTLTVLNRTGQVIPALVGPLTLVFSSLHVFTYIGMFLWGGAITVGKQIDSIPLFYDLNNFNDYLSGLLTMFNVFVVNDWNAIANVYLQADRCSSPWIVYTFFIGANLVGVSIMMNVLTAFFVGAFVTKVESNTNGNPENGTSKIRLQMSNENTPNNPGNPQIERVRTVSGTRPEFLVCKRLGYDDVIQTVTGDNDAISVASKAHDVLEIFARLSPTTNQQIAHLICCQKSQDYFGNKRFLSIAKAYINEADTHRIISEMVSELIDFPSVGSEEKIKSSCCVQRVFPSLTDCLDGRQLTLSASLIHQNPYVALFIARGT